MRGTVAALALLVVAVAAATARGSAEAAPAATRTFVAEVWADNWFALYVNGKLVGRDSVPITTERSFNSERITFRAAYPFTIGILAKDYIGDASGLEYIGTPQQQMGDGGLVAQVRDRTTGKVVASTNGRWRVYPLQRAPLNQACVTSAEPLVDCKSETHAAPARWAAPSYDDSAWARASVYSAAAVGVKDGYFDIGWSPAARLVWGGDLHVDNILLLRSPAVG